MKTIATSLLLLLSLQAHSVCQKSDAVFSDSGDDKGVSLDLAYECDASGEEICIYTNSEIASVTGTLAKQNISTSDYYRRIYNVSSATTNILAMTGLWQSFFDHQEVKVNLNNQTLKGIISVTKDGADPASSQKKSTVTANISCQAAEL